MKEAKCGAERAKSMGSYGWQKPDAISINRRFLNSLVINTSKYNERKNNTKH